MPPYMGPEVADHADFYNRLQVRHLNFQRRKSAKRTQFCVPALGTGGALDQSAHATGASGGRFDPAARHRRGALRRPPIGIDLRAQLRDLCL